jgi:mycoredoxin
MSTRKGTVRGMSTPVTMYTTTWCGYCRRLKRQMEDEGIRFREVDVDERHDYDERIVAATGGFRTVPTVEVEGRLLVNPTLREIKAAVGADRN